ncbi:MAG: hypothetical protein R3C61_25490 [Bacteroidia bacterium]
MVPHPTFTDFASFLDREVGSAGTPERNSFYTKAYLFKLKNIFRYHPSLLIRAKAWFAFHLPRRGKRMRQIEEGEYRFDHKIQSNEWLLEMRGTAISHLRMQGKVKIGEKYYDATSRLGVIHKGEHVRVKGCKFHELEVVLDN